MRKRNSLFVCFLLLFVALNLSAVRAADEESLGKEAEQAGNIREAVTHYISALQSVSEGSSKDRQLREKIIKLVQGMTPQPAMPEEAERYFARGKAAVKGASTAKDFEDAANEFNKALMIAPWLAEGYYNLGIVQDKAGKYQDAIRSLKLYLLASPSATDVKEVKSLMFEIEYRQEKAQKEAVAKKKEEEAKPDFSGVWMEAGLGWLYKFLISGREFAITATSESGGDAYTFGTGTMEGRNFEGSSPGVQSSLGMQKSPIRFKGSLSGDNKTIQISTMVAPELAKTQEYREIAQRSIQFFGSKSSATWTRVSK